MRHKPSASDEYKKQLNNYHSLADRHVLVLEADLSEDEKRFFFHYADKVKRVGNDLVSVMRKNMEQLFRTKRYRILRKIYGEFSDAKDNAGKKSVAREMEAMQEEYGVTWDYCRNAAKPLCKKYSVSSVVGLTKAEDVWRAVEKCLFSNGRIPRFSKRGDLPCIRAKQRNRCIVINSKNNRLCFRFGQKEFGVLKKDRFEEDEVSSITHYLEQPEIVDRKAAQILQEDGECISTYRPCYASIVCKEIRGRLRVYVHITVEGKAILKYNNNGDLRHAYGNGVVGCDIGTQTIAYTSDSEVGLKNLAERGQSIEKSERQERLIYRAMDRSRRATNPDNYNADGTVKTGAKQWKYSNHYKKLQARHKELCRKNAQNRRLAINEDVNHIRSLGNIFVTEPKNSKKLQRRAAITTTNKKGKTNRKKRFGKSIRNRCPGTFQAKIKQIFENTGGVYIEVSYNYRASQYDHTADEYIKKKLSNRMYNLRDGTRVQRDCYSSFLLYCIDRKTGAIDKDKCKDQFAEFYIKEIALVNKIKANGTKVMNSGIKAA